MHAITLEVKMFNIRVFLNIQTSNQVVHIIFIITRIYMIQVFTLCTVNICNKFGKKIDEVKIQILTTIINFDNNFNFL